MSWEVEYTYEFEEWWDGLDEEDQIHIDAAVRFLMDKGPSLGRPFVDTVTGSRFPNMKELRPRSGNIRILFAFDPRRTAILLLGGDKTGRWQEWYQEMIPVADRLFEEHLKELEHDA